MFLTAISKHMINKYNCTFGCKLKILKQGHKFYFKIIFLVIVAYYKQNCNKKNVNNDNYILLSCVCRLASSAQSLRHHHQKDLSTVLQPIKL